jgi:hypothetical protein
MSHHEPFKSLGPVDWTDITSQSESDSLPSFLTTTFASAQTLIDSIPDPPASSKSAASTGRARAATESAAYAPPHVTAAPPQTTTGDADVAAKLKKDWKEVKVGAKENPMGMSVWKLSAKDGKGAWFARRSTHRELPFETWKAGLEREFEETLQRNAGAAGGEVNIGDNKIRGIGAEKRVEDLSVEGVARLQVFLLSVRFPGPTTPRDFVTLLVTSDGGEEGEKRGKGRKPRQFMVVSKPCQHPDCPERNGFIRGKYESVEIIREVPVDKPLRRVRSSVDMSRDEFARLEPGVGKEAMRRSAKQAAGEGGDGDVPSVRHAKSDVGAEDEEEPEYAIEWLMITRSDPGGSVPRFMVEKGTPPGICTDAGKFVKWLFSEDFNKQGGTTAGEGKGEGEAKEIKGSEGQDEKGPPLPRRKPTNRQLDPIPDTDTEEAGGNASGGLYGMITNALGTASSMVASFTGSARATDSEVDTLDEDSSDTSSTASDGDYASAEEGEPTPMPKTVLFEKNNDLLSSAQSTKSAISDESAAPSTAGGASRHEKELRKLEDRRRRAEEKMTLALAKQNSGDKDKSQKEKDKEAAALQKLKEKHEKELAKQQEKYQREVRRLEEKKAREQRKEEERRRKALEKEERANVQMELERTRAERDVALKQMEILKEQVGELQAQNTMLVAKLGKATGGKVDEVAE